MRITLEIYGDRKVSIGYVCEIAGVNMAGAAMAGAACARV